MPSGFRLFALLGAALAFAGCDSSTDGQPLDPSAPEVSDFEFSPSRVVFDEVVENDSANVDLAFSIRASDDSEVEQVRYTVVWQFAPPQTQPAASGNLEPNGDGTYTGSASLRLGRDERGVYSVLVYAEDRDGLLSNQAFGTFTLGGPGLGPPVIEEISGPAEFQLPAAGAPPNTLRLVAAVTDPDGAKNVARVELRPPAGGLITLYDDGRTLGDTEADDGLFTAAFQIAEAEPGPQTFVFRAFDRDGLAGETVPFTVTILE